MILQYGSDFLTDSEPQPVLDGSWEQRGRSPNAAALTALLGIGAIYFNAQSILVSIAVFTKALTSKMPQVTGGFLDQMAEMMKFSSGPVRVTLVMSEFVFMLLPAVWLVRRWHSSTVREYVRMKNGSFVEILLAVLATLALIPAVDSIANLLTNLMHVPERLKEVNAEIFTARTPGEFVWLILVVCVTPAICEETFFRGHIQRTFERTIGWKSVLLIGVLFGLFHFQPLGLITLSILGMLLGYFYFRSRSLFPGMAAHFTNNFVAIAVLYRASGTSPTFVSAYEQLSWWLIAASFVLGVVFLAIFHRITVKQGTHVYIA